MDTLATDTIDYCSLVAHPFADLMPMIQEWEFNDLVADIAAKGLIHAIVIYDGMILDGRNRHKACCRLFAEGKFEWHPDHHIKTFHGDEAEAIAYVESLNVTRRHLTNSQRAMCMARMLEMKHGITPRGVSAVTDVVEQAAESAGVGVYGIIEANMVRARCPAHIIGMVERGDVAASLALKACRGLTMRRMNRLDTPEKVIKAGSRNNANSIPKWSTARLLRHLAPMADALSGRELSAEECAAVREIAATLKGACK
jgi:hypothetical protein